MKQKAPTLAERLRTAREARGLTVADLARATVVDGETISRQAIMKLESGTATNPGIDTVAALAVALDVPPEWLAWNRGPAPTWPRVG